jgi:hypothetical protein
LGTPCSCGGGCVEPCGPCWRRHVRVEGAVGCDSPWPRPHEPRQHQPHPSGNATLAPYADNSRDRAAAQLREFSRPTKPRLVRSNPMQTPARPADAHRGLEKARDGGNSDPLAGSPSRRGISRGFTGSMPRVRSRGRSGRPEARMRPATQRRLPAIRQEMGGFGGSPPMSGVSPTKAKAKPKRKDRATPRDL